MNIDLFLTPDNEAGIVCDMAFRSPVAGVILDAQTHELTLEFGDLDNFHLNIPVEEIRKDKMLFAHRIYVGFLDQGMLVDAFEAPLLYLNDPYGGKFGEDAPLARPHRAVPGFENFMKRCTFAQPLHRDNLGDEDGARSVLRGIDPQALQLSPALMRQLQMAAIPRAAVAPQMPGLGGAAQRQQTSAPQKKEDDNKDR